MQKKNKINKKKWSKPKLIVLVKGKEEENILTNCKTGLAGAPVSQLAGPYNCDYQVCPNQCSGIVAS